jgi:hypothetical protein
MRIFAWRARLSLASALALALVAMAAGAAQAASGSYRVAFQASTTDLWITGPDGPSNLGLGMMGGTSPSIAALTGGVQDAAAPRPVRRPASRSGASGGV